MRPGEVVLCVDYGTSGAAAVLVDRGGGWVSLGLEAGREVLSGGVYLDEDGSWLVGDAAWRAGLLRPDRFEASPLRWLRQDRCLLGGVEVDPLDAVAATLRRVAQQADARLGAPPGEVRLLVPAEWGPRRRTAIREAGRRAGLGVTNLVDAAVAAAAHLVASGRTIVVGSLLLLVDWGGGLSGTVLRRGPYGFEVLSTISAPDAGGLALDEVLAGRLSTPVHAAVDWSTGPETALSWRAAARQARETLGRAAAVTVAAPAGPPVVLTAAGMLEAARPVVMRAAAVLQRSIAAAEVPADRLAGVFCAGGLAHDRAMVDLLAKESGLPVVALDDPGRVAVLGAAHATGPARDTRQVVGEPPQPRVRQVAAMVLPAVAALLLYGHFLLSADLHRGPGIGYDPTAYLLANWGELALASVFTLVTFLTAAVMIAATLPVDDPGTEPGSPLRDTQQIGAGLLAAAALGVAACGLNAIFAAVILQWSTAPFLRWAVLPPLPIVAVVAATAAVATRWGRVPAGGWHAWLNFPAGSIWVATVGTVLVQVAQTTPAELSTEVAGRVGGLLLGVATALLVARRRAYRLIAAAPLCVFTAGIVGASTTGILALVYVTAATGWWARRAWALANQPRGLLPHRR
jgi:Hsp70 protein